MMKVPVGKEKRGDLVVETAKTVATEGDKQHSEIWNSKVYEYRCGLRGVTSRV